MPEQWGEDMAEFCYAYKMTPDQFFYLTDQQYQALRDKLIAEAGRAKDGG